MKDSKSVTHLYIIAALLGAGVLTFVLLNPQNTYLLFLCRLVALALVAALALVVVWILKKGRGDGIGLQNFAQPVQTSTAPPPPPGMPQNIAPQEVCEGSVRGALHACENFASVFSEPRLSWQMERSLLALKAILKALEDGAEPSLVVDFATQYLPSAMQFVAACAAEGCPPNALNTMIGMACACEKQQDCLTAGETASFEQEYGAIREALNRANFQWRTY